MSAGTTNPLSADDISRYKGAWRLDRTRPDKEGPNAESTAKSVQRSIDHPIHKEDFEGTRVVQATFESGRQAR